MGENSLALATEITPERAQLIKALGKVRYDRDGNPKPPKPAEQHGMVVLDMLNNEDIYYVRYNNSFYQKSVKNPYLYALMDRRDLTDVIQRYMLKREFFFDEPEFKRVIGLMEVYMPVISQISRRFIMVSEHIFWDSEKGDLVEAPSEPTFFRLFDSEEGIKHVACISEFTEEQEARLWEMYETVKGELEQGKEVERFQPLKDWADGSHDVYMDLHRAHAYSFLKVKPLGSYLLTGLRRNGKSTYIGMTHTIFGSRNTSKLQLTQLGNPRQNLVLSHTLMNGPDEEEDKAIENQGLFKTLADHGNIMLDVFREQAPVNVRCDFMCFFPMNHVPEWKGSGAGACMNRSLIIPFTADLSGKDNAGEDFAQKTFTADFMCEYMGSVFAYAYHYHRHPIVKSETMLREQQVLEGELDSTITYANLFKEWFTGFSKYDVVYKDYRAWCNIEDYPYRSLKELKNALSKLMKGLKRKNVRIDGEITKMYVVEEPGVSHQYFYPEYEIPEFKRTVEEIQGGALNRNRAELDPYAEFSVIERLENWKAKKNSEWRV